MKSNQERMIFIVSLIIGLAFSMMVLEGCATSKKLKQIRLTTVLSPSEEYLRQCLQKEYGFDCDKIQLSGIIVSRDSIGVEIVKDSSGLKNGEAIVFCRNGNIIRGFYENNRKNGIWVYYNNDLSAFQTSDYCFDFESLRKSYVDGKIVQTIMFSPKW